jgi:RsiG-like
VTEPAMTMGSARAAEVLAPGFAEDLSDLPTDEVRRRRDETLAEREFLSYLRRLVQVRQDILADERRRRETGEEPAPLVERLTAAMSAGRKPEGSRGEALRTLLSDADIDEAERQAESLLPGLSNQDPADLAQEELDRAVETLAQAEREVSSRRGEVLRIHDQLQEELKGRYRANPAEIPTEV